MRLGNKIADRHIDLTLVARALGLILDLAGESGDLHNIVGRFAGRFTVN